MEDLIEGLQEEIIRCRGLLKLYEETPAGVFNAAMIKAEILAAGKAIANGNSIEMMESCKSLKEYE